MNEKILEVADALVKVADSLRGIASESFALPEPQGEVEAAEISRPKTEMPENKIVTIEEVRAVLAKKSQEGKTKEIKTLLNKYDAGKLSGVKPEDYAALLKEAEVL